MASNASTKHSERDVDAIHSAGKNRMLEKFETLYRSDRYTDLTIRCGTVNFLVHRNIVCTQSEFFATALENDMEEAKTGSINLHDDEFQMVDAMLQSLYFHHYYVKCTACIHKRVGAQIEWIPFFDCESCQKENGLIGHIKACATGDKYFIQHLQDLAEVKFCVRGMSTKTNAKDILEAAEAITTRRLGNADRLRQTVADIMYSKSMELAELAESQRTELNETLGLGLEILLSHMRTQKNSIKLRCPDCHHLWDWIGPRPASNGLSVRCPSASRTNSSCTRAYLFDSLENNAKVV